VNEPSREGVPVTERGSLVQQKTCDSPSDSMATAEEILKLHDEKGAEVAVLKGKVKCASPQSHASFTIANISPCITNEW
jgi:hypothetical protein